MYGPAETLRWNEDVRKFYMGLSTRRRRKLFQDVTIYKRHERWYVDEASICLPDRLPWRRASQEIANWTYLDCCRA